VLVSHDLNLVGELCDRVLLMSRGRRVAFGSPEQVLEKGQLEQVFGASVFVEASPKTGRPRVQVEWLDGEARR
jgi:iron complex transport system ATP-binding protein